ncbi:4'-phosphopantetheinyl transferase family protein [Thermomonospora catenispora]|uniref:4'-phosphopantetheinyl transferase family protein n=1 Tax=Thermomonospora catenispora TaxID=2493090 RepID=UPI001F4F52A1|nr:4'-phosphopantetheinyl transferase superfamily protein [Thermomonospora catenispora]
MLECQVWWARREDVRPWHVDLLNDTERARRDRYRREADRDRFTVGVAVTRLAAGALLGVRPERVPVDRTCPGCGAPHGRPVIEGGPQLSVSHSGDLVVVALSRGGPVGVDVEQDSGRLGEGIVRQLLGSEEVADLRDLGAAWLRRGLLTYWTRKEAVVKATGDGLRVPLTDVRVSAPDEPPRLLSWKGRRDLPGRMTLRTLAPGPGYAACLALIDQPDPVIVERSASPGLAEPGSWDAGQ